MESSQTKKSIAIIGGGASALFFATTIDSSKFSVTIYEKNKSLGRKFLVAGDGGFNLTHSEPIEDMIARYSPSDFLQAALKQFDNVSYRKWLLDIGVPTFVGSSKRVYPEKGIKPIEVFNAILKVIKKNNIKIEYEQEWMGWKGNDLLFNFSNNVKADIVIFALGGASWSKTGSKGDWLHYFEEQEVRTIPFESSNCAFEVKWDEDFSYKFSGQPLKNISLSCGNSHQKGELVITKFGLEGNAIYALSPCIREQIQQNKLATVYIDFKPTLTIERILEILNSKQNRSKILKEKLKLSTSIIAWVKLKMTKDEFLNNEVLAKNIKSFPVELVSAAKIEEAISTVGGIPINELNSSFELKKKSGYYCIGEMIDWDAPTGGYLLQACYSMGRTLGMKLNKKCYKKNEKPYS